MPLKENEYVTGRPMKTDSTGQQVAGSAYVLFLCVLFCFALLFAMWAIGAVTHFFATFGGLVQ